MAVGADGGSTGGPVWAQLADLTHGGILATGPNITNTAYGRGPISNASEGVGVFTLSSTTMIQLQQFTTSGGTDAYNMTAQLGRIEVWKM